MEHSSRTFNNANEAFEFYYKKINSDGVIYSNTKCLFNEGFVILYPTDNKISSSFRKWKYEYAEYEWNWYMSGNRSVSEIKKIAKIWDKMHGGDDLVWSNYGWQWNRFNQIDYVVNELKRDKNSRRAYISIYDGKEHNNYTYDTPCTLNIGFMIVDNCLNMTVLMRSNDLWFGFCNDQYCFSKLLSLIAERLELKIGSYYHFASNLHLYERHLK